MDFSVQFFYALIDLSNAMAPYIVFGLFFAGILHELVPETFVSKHLGNDSIGSVIKATIFGVPLPICSCGVIPLATSLKKSGASKGATLSFLISTPITGVDSILATYGMFGWAFTLYRVITSMIISIIAGLLTNFISEKDTPKATFSTTPVGVDLQKHSLQNKDMSDASHCDSSSCCAKSGKKGRFSFVDAMSYAFGTLLGDIASALLIGLLVGAFITVAVPANLSEILIEYSWLAYIIVIAIAIPMYVCATASLPIAAGLIVAGVSPGAAFVFLSAGPATNTVTMSVVKKMLGVKTLYIYLGTIILGSIIFGFGLDYLLKDVSVRDMIQINESSGIMTWLSSAFLWSMVLYFILKPYFKIEPESCSNANLS
jgi:uncharacterized membrane protein YraQ (UPF0718 family)